MGSISTRTALGITTVAWVLAMPGGAAYATQQCGAAYHQEDQETGADYQQIEKTLLDDGTLQKLNDFASQLDGRWQGNGLEIKCGVSDDQPLTTVTNFDVNAEITQHFLGAMLLEVEQETKRKVNLDRIFITPGTQRYDQGQKTGQRNYRVDLSSPATMVFDEKYRTRRFRPLLDREELVIDPDTAETVIDEYGVRLVHEIKTVALNDGDNTLTIKRDIYINGLFTAQQEWQLTRL